MTFASVSPFLILTALSVSSFSAFAKSSQQQAGEKALKAMTGCYLVDYSYVETEALMPGYTRDSRVYDVNTDKSVKEWIYAEELSENRVFLQHVLFAADADGKFIEGSLLKHTGEDWVYNPESYLRMTGSARWVKESLPANNNQWIRKITHLDDGPRYQCSGTWKETAGAYPEYACEALSPIPGRESRDMRRRDYQLLQRESKVIVYSGNWLERQNNVKLIEKDDQVTPLAKEVGKNWYVRLPDSECQEAQAYVASRKPFWQVLREAWDEALLNSDEFVELTPPGMGARYGKIFALDRKYEKENLADPKIRAAAKAEILQVIQQYRR